MVNEATKLLQFDTSVSSVPPDMYVFPHQNTDDSFILQERSVPPPAWAAQRTDQVQGVRGGAGEPHEYSSLEKTGRLRPQHVWDDPKDSDTPKKVDSENRGSGRKRIVDSGEGSECVIMI